MEKAYTTFQIAGICGVRPTTIIKWIQQNRLKAFVTPGGHRRVKESDLLRFLKHYRLPIPEGIENKNLKRIVIVEDEAALGKMLKRALDGAFGSEAEVEWIQDGIQALIGIGQKPVDMVILDVVMPVVDGAKVLSSLKADPRTSKIKVVAMTGKKLTGEKLKFVQDNTNAFYYKPFDVNAFVKEMGKLLGLTDSKESAEVEPTSKSTAGRRKAD